MLTISPSSKYHDIAWQYITMVTEGMNALPFDVAQGVIPVRKSVFARYRNGLPGYPYFNVIAAAYKVTHFRPWIPQYPKIVEQIYTAIEKAVAGKATPKEALDAAAAATNKILAG